MVDHLISAMMIPVEWPAWLHTAIGVRLQRRVQAHAFDPTRAEERFFIQSLQPPARDARGQVSVDELLRSFRTMSEKLSAQWRDVEEVASKAAGELLLEHYERCLRARVEEKTEVIREVRL